MRKYIFAVIIAGFSLCCGYGLSMAADPMAGIAVIDRSFPKLQPIGFRLGAFTLYPSLEKEVNYTSNVFQTTEDEKADRIYVLRPSVTGVGRFGKHELSFDVKATHMAYANEDEQNYTNYNAAIQNSFHFSKALRIDVGGILSRNHARRLESIGAEVVGAEAIESDVRGLFAKLILEPAQFRWELGVNYAQTSFQDVNERSTNNLVVQRDRDHSSISLDANVIYNAGTRIKPFLGFSYSRTTYDHLNHIDGSGFTGNNQDRDRADILVGVHFAPTGKLRGSAKIGYGYEMAKDDTLDNQGDSLVNIDLTYLYTPLTNFNLGFERFFTDDTSAVQGVVETRLSASVIHELTRQWILSAGTQITRRDF